MGQLPSYYREGLEKAEKHTIKLNRVHFVDNLNSKLLIVCRGFHYRNRRTAYVMEVANLNDNCVVHSLFIFIREPTDTMRLDQCQQIYEAEVQPELDKAEENCSIMFNSLSSLSSCPAVINLIDNKVLMIKKLPDFQSRCPVITHEGVRVLSAVLTERWFVDMASLVGACFGVYGPLSVRRSLISEQLCKSLIDVVATVQAHGWSFTEIFLSDFVAVPDLSLEYEVSSFGDWCRLEYSTSDAEFKFLNGCHLVDRSAMSPAAADNAMKRDGLLLGRALINVIFVGCEESDLSEGLAKRYIQTPSLREIYKISTSLVEDDLNDVRDLSKVQACWAPSAPHADIDYACIEGACHFPIWLTDLRPIPFYLEHGELREAFSAGQAAARARYASRMSREAAT